MEEYELHKQLYKGKASLLYKAICKVSGMFVAMKLYRKARLSELNWYQVRLPGQTLISVHTLVSSRCTCVNTSVSCPAGAAGDQDT